MAVERCELVTDYDPEDPSAYTPYLGRVVGGEEYTFLLTIVPDGDHFFGEDMEIGFYEDGLYSWDILEQTEQRITLAVTFTAEHDWDEWTVVEEPTEEEDGLARRVCRFDPSHEETVFFTIGTDPYAPLPEYGDTDSPEPPAPADAPPVSVDEPERGDAEQHSGAPDTGDRSNPTVWFAAAGLSLACVIALIVVWKKRGGDK